MFVPDVKYLAFREESREQGRKLTVPIYEINQRMQTVLLFFPRKIQGSISRLTSRCDITQRFCGVKPVASTAVSR